MKREILTAFLGAGLALTAGSIAAQAETIRLAVGSGHPADAAVWVTSVRDYLVPEINKRVAERTKHKIEWTTAYGGSVCKLGECLTSVKDGLLDVAVISAPFNPSQLLAHNFSYFVPFSSGDILTVARAAVKVYEQNPELAGILDKRYGQHHLSLSAIGNYGLLTTFAWKSLDDIKGKRLAAAGPNIPWVEAVGAVPVQSNLNEAYTSMQTGVYGGWVMFPDGVVGFKLHEVAKNYTQTDFGSQAVNLITVNKSTWQGLPADVRDIFTEVGKDYIQAASQMAIDKEKRSLETMKGTSTIRQLTWEEKVAWANTLPHIPKIRTEDIRKAGQPQNVVRDYIRALKEAGVKMPRDWEEGL